MTEQAQTQKILFLGIDGMDPNLTRKYVNEGKMPHIKKIIERGACREDLHMLGSVPTITPPMWATLATGANPNVHGITCFWNQSKNSLDALAYSLDSSCCKAERLWDVFAEAGKKTLVFHWPAGAWPPYNDNPNLAIIDGATPACINFTCAVIDLETLITASTTIKEIGYARKVKVNNGAGCILGEESEMPKMKDTVSACASTGETVNLMFVLEDGEGAIEHTVNDMSNSPIYPATGWEMELPEDTLEFVISFKDSTIRRMGLIFKNSQGIYDTVKLYKNKKSKVEFCKLSKERELALNVQDDYVVDGKLIPVTRLYFLTNLDENGSTVGILAGNALDNSNDSHFHPRELHKKITDACGPICCPLYSCGEYPKIVKKALMPSWRGFIDWQSKAMNQLIKEEGFEIVFSHMHNVDSYGHQFWHWCKNRSRKPDISEEYYQKLLEQGYIDTDNYIGEFEYLLDEGWTIFIFSDHGLLINEEEHPALMGDPFGVNITIMKELGYTVLKKDENGEELAEIDWEKTKAVASRGNHIWINLKGRNNTGIVDPSEKYNLEEEIISALYSYRDEDGKRIISVAMRNKEAAIVGMSGPECGDIIYWLVEGKNRLHGDSLSTFTGYLNTTVSPIFIAAGTGIKEGFYTERVIRETDLAPTAAAIAGVRMPAQCEGAPIYQIIK